MNNAAYGCVADFTPSPALSEWESVSHVVVIGLEAVACHAGQLASGSMALS